MSRFPVLATISIVLKVLAALVLLVGFFAGIAADGGGQLIVAWIGAFVTAVGLFAYAEIIAVVFAIEENTRASHDALVSLARPPSGGTRTSWLPPPAADAAAQRAPRDTTGRPGWMDNPPR